MRRIVLFCILFCFSACSGPIRIVVRPGSNFTFTSSVTVIHFESDTENVHGRLESLLMSNGFNVISSVVSSTRIEYEETVEGSQGKTKTEGSIGAVTKLKADYALRYSYGTRADFPAGRVFTSFIATVVQIKSGTIVASADFTQGAFSGRTIDSVLRDFIKRLAQEIQ